MEKYQIHKAALESDYDYAMQLIGLNTNLDELDNNGHTPLHWAVFRGDIDFVKLLLEAGANPNVISADGVTPQWRARDFGLTEIDQLLADHEGKILINQNFDHACFSIFNGMINQPLPVKDTGEAGLKESAEKRRWWQFWK